MGSSLQEQLLKAKLISENKYKEEEEKKKASGEGIKIITESEKERKQREAKEKESRNAYEEQRKNIAIQRQLDAEEEQEELPEVKAKFPVEFKIESGKVLFGELNNLASARNLLDQPSAIKMPQERNEGTVLSRYINFWVPAEVGKWQALPVVNNQKGEQRNQTFLLCHESVDPVKTLRHIFRVAPLATNSTTEEIFQKGVFIVHRYDWSLEKESKEEKELGMLGWNKFDGPHCFFIDHSIYDKAVSYVKDRHKEPKHKCYEAKLDFFSKGFVMYYPDEEYSFARFHLNEKREKVNAFLFHTYQTNFKGAKLGNKLIWPKKK